MSGFNTFSEWQTIKDLKPDSRAELVPLEAARAIASFRLPVKLYDMWLALPGDLPPASRVTPSWLGAEMLPNMYILDVLDGGQDFRWRLFGTTHAARYGTEATGKLMSDAAKKDRSAHNSLQVARQVCATGKPLFFLTEFLGLNGPIRHTSTVALPLAGKDGRLARLFGCSIWH